MSEDSRRKPSTDKRSLRSQELLRRALAEELQSGVELSHVTVAALTRRAGLTRRTFYSHYKDIAQFIDCVEDDILAHLRELFSRISTRTLSEVYAQINRHEPCPGSVELLSYCKDNAALMAPLMGPGGDPQFDKRVSKLAYEMIYERMFSGLELPAFETFFNFYLISFVAAEKGIVQAWLCSGCKETPEMMARLMTVIAFVRPGDLYGESIDVNVPEYAQILEGIKQLAQGEKEESSPATAVMTPIILHGAERVLRRKAQAFMEPDESAQ